MNKKLFLLPLLLSLGTISASEKKITVRAGDLTARSIKVGLMSCGIGLMASGVALFIIRSPKRLLFDNAMRLSNATKYCTYSSIVLAGGTMATTNPSDTLTVSYKKEKSRPF